MAAALATFVKTPGRTPLKTRLAATLGAARARAVYEESLRLLRVQLHAAAAQGLRVHWAVAEQEAVSDPCWSDFPAFWTGPGTLGERLCTVYAHLRQDAPRALLIGADAPQLTAATLLAAARDCRTVVGPAHDGGFYLFASAQEMTSAQWLAPAYSTADTLQQLCATLPQPPVHLPPLTDIDDVASLHACIGEFPCAHTAQPLRALLHN